MAVCSLIDEEFLFLLAVYGVFLPSADDLLEGTLTVFDLPFEVELELPELFFEDEVELS